MNDLVNELVSDPYLRRMDLKNDPVAESNPNSDSDSYSYPDSDRDYNL